MNKTRYVPFERNRYFYGKLLTVRDFMSEQTYNMDKRRLANRLLFGSGVVSGLQVVAVDDKSISVETGVALDPLGREIVVSSPVTMKLSMLEGFTNNDYAKNVYLCIAYDEKGKEPVHSVAGASGRSEEVSEHNRILETFRLFVREEPPTPEMREYDHIVADTSVWYEDAQIRILQTAPRYIEPEQTFDIRLTIEKTLQTPHVEFEYEPDWPDFEILDELPQGKIKFSEPTDGGESSYVKTIHVKARPLPPGEAKRFGVLNIKSGSLRLVVGDRVIQEWSRIEQQIEISEQPVSERIMQAYYTRSLDRAIEAPANPCVYLAKINLLQMGATYAIDSVESATFQEPIINPTMLYKLLQATDRFTSNKALQLVTQVEKQEREEEIREFPDLKEEFQALRDEIEEQKPERYVATGITEISIIPAKKEKWWHRKQRDFFTEEIDHGLGAGPVWISSGLSDEMDEDEVAVPEMWNRSDTIYYGPQSMFAKSEYASEFPNVTIGTIHYPKRGTFRLGVRVHGKTERTRLRLRWWAVKPQPLEADESAGVAEVGQTASEAAASRS